jgi:hypothetical protein
MIVIAIRKISVVFMWRRKFSMVSTPITRWPASTTGSPCRWCSFISAQASFNSVPNSTLSTSLVMMSAQQRLSCR